MQLLMGISFILILICIILCFNIRVSEIEKITNFILCRKPRNLNEMAVKKQSHIVRYILLTQAMLKATGQTGKTYTIITAALILSFIGFTFGVTIGNYFVAPVLAIGFAFVPFLYVKFQHVKYNKLVIEELEVSLSTISISYERSENIILAIEENIENMHAPIKSIFESFVFTVNHVNPNIEFAIDEMKSKLNHSVFKEWCDSLKRCVHNRGLKYILRPTVNKLTKIKIVTGDLQNILYDANLNFWIMLIVNCVLLVVGIYLVPNSLQTDLPETLSNGLIAINAALMAYSAIKVSLETRDINFDI